MADVSALAREIKGCVRCPDLSAEMRRCCALPSVGRGSASAPILVLGSAPTMSDACPDFGHGRPWAGQAGWRLAQMLAHALHHAGLVDSELADVFSSRPDGRAGQDASAAYRERLWGSLERAFFFCNHVRCVPTSDASHGPARRACAPWTHRTIYAVDPVLVLAIGRGVAADLLGVSPDMSTAREPGKLYEAHIPSPVTGKPVAYGVVVLETMQRLIEANDAKTIKTKGAHHQWCVQAACALSVASGVMRAAGTDGLWDKRLA